MQQDAFTPADLRFAKVLKNNWILCKARHVHLSNCFILASNYQSTNFLQVSAAEDATWAARSMLTLSEMKVQELEAKQADLLQQLEVMKLRVIGASEGKSPSKVICFRK